MNVYMESLVTVTTAFR